MASRKYEKLKEEKSQILQDTKLEAEKFHKIADEAERVANVANHAEIIISDLDRQFEKATKLNKFDVKFIFFATALQCVRQYFLSNDKFRFKNDQAASKTLKKYVPISLTGPVPYDAFKKNGFKDKTRISGANHRYTTLGHDPLLGWIFGTMNILTDTVTENHIPLKSYSTELIGNEYKITGNSDMIEIITGSLQRIEDKPVDLALAVLKHAAHLASDAFTKMGLPLTIPNVISPKLSKILLKNGIDTYSVGRGIALASFINMLVSMIHALYYDESVDGDQKLYQVRTKKVLSYSNALASGSNLIAVAITGEGKFLDIGGLMVTLYRLINDYKFIKSIKEEFLEKEFYNIVMGTEIEM